MTPSRAWRFAADVAVNVAPRFETNSGEAAIAAAIGGGGITAALCYQVDAALRSGELVEVLERFATPALPIQAVFPSSRLLSAKVRAFLRRAEDASRD